MQTRAHEPEQAGVSSAVAHAVGWLVTGNAVGLYLSYLLLHPAWQLGELSYGRWVPVHLNVQLYGWTALPLVAWLLSIYQVDRSRVAIWGPAAVWAWSGALAIGIWQWLGGVTTGRIFLDWKDGALWAMLAAMMVLWCVLTAAWQERSGAWPITRKRWTQAALIGLALVPVALLYKASPAVYAPLGSTTGSTTGGSAGTSLLGLALAFVGFMLLLLRVWWLPKDWAGYSWPEGSRVWRIAIFGWWVLLVAGGLVMYQPGVLERLNFTNSLVAHSHLALAGFTTSFCGLLIVLLTRRRLGHNATVAVWQLSALAMIATLAVMGWREGAGRAWMTTQPAWRTVGWMVRAHCGELMLVASLLWWWERITLCDKAGATVLGRLVPSYRQLWRPALAVCFVALVAVISHDRQAPAPSAARQRGLRGYIAEGCIHCHSQNSRPGSPDESIWGPVRQVAEVMPGEPELLGHRRQGPDLTNVGARRSEPWLKLHLRQPRALAPNSQMPSYAHLCKDGRGDDLVKYLKESGVGAIGSVMAQAARWQPAGTAAGGDGKALFMANCAACHGAKGEGNGPLAGNFAKPPANLTKRPFLWTNPGDALELRVARIIKFGLPGRDMPGHETLADGEARTLTEKVLELRR